MPSLVCCRGSKIRWSSLQFNMGERLTKRRQPCNNHINAEELKSQAWTILSPHKGAQIEVDGAGGLLPLECDCRWSASVGPALLPVPEA
nr:hypothetical protein Iba_chr06aCG13790 [Ipomoea batatas]